MSVRAICLVSIVAALGASACSTATLTAGASLSQAGQTASMQMSQNVELSTSTMVSLRQAVAFSDGFNNQIGNADSQTFLTNEAAIEQKLSQKAKMLDSLASAYSALGSLSSYDASGAFNTSINALAGDATAFGKTIDPKFAIPSQAITGVGQLGGLVLSAEQASEVKDASSKIEAILKSVIALLDDPHTRSLLVMNSAEVTGVIGQAADETFASNVYSYDTLLDAIGAPLNLKSNSGSDAVVSKNANLQRGLRNVAVEMTQEQVDAIGASYDKELSALKALLPLHDNLQNGAPLDLDAVISATAQLQTIATALKPAKGR